MEHNPSKHQIEVANRQFALGISLLSTLPMVACTYLELSFQHTLIVGGICGLLSIIISLFAPPVSMGDEFNTTAFMVAVPYAAAFFILVLFDVDHIHIILALTIALGISSAAAFVHVLRCWFQHPSTMFH